MTWLIVSLVIAVVLLALTVFRAREHPPAVNPEEAVRAAVELHRIGRQLDAAYLKSQQQRDGAQLRREIGDRLDDGGDGP